MKQNIQCECKYCGKIHKLEYEDKDDVGLLGIICECKGFAKAEIYVPEIVKPSEEDKDTWNPFKGWFKKK